MKVQIVISQYGLKPKIGIRPNMVLKMREFSNLVRAFTVWERSKKFGVEFSISWCSLFKWEEKKKFGSSL